MISIITAVRNQLDMNRLYWEKLNEYATLPFELIIIDNASTDGSAEFFEEKGVKVIRNKGNFSYPHCQNQGIRAAKYDFLGFFNNDIIVCPHWDSRLIEMMKSQQIDFVSPATNDRLETSEATRKNARWWKYIKYPLITLGGSTYENLKRMHRWRYGNWENYTEKRYKKFGNSFIEDFSGSCVLATRRGMNLVGGFWDERLQAADFDLYMQVRKRSLTIGDIRPMQVALGVYFHHYSRLTLRSKHYVPFVDAKKIISIEEKWGNEAASLLEKLDWK